MGYNGNRMRKQKKTLLQPIADRVAQHLENNSKNSQFSTKPILMGFIIYYLVLIVNPMGRIQVRWKRFRINLEMLCHPICNWLYTCYGVATVSRIDEITGLFCRI